MGARSEEVQWPLGTATVYATLVTPRASGPFPAVVMAAGSGPTDRDWNSALLPGTNGSARLLAEALADAGFASLRYDKCASGPHAGENMAKIAGTLSMRSHRDEFAGGVRLLAQRPGIRSDRIFGLGNSEGALHVLHYQLERPPLPLAGMVLAGPPGRPVAAVVRSQLAAQADALPDGQAWLALYDAAVARFVAGEPTDPDPALPDGVRVLLRSLEVPANLPFARELWTADAASLLEGVEVPVLVVIGKKDLQVDWRMDGDPLAQVAGRRAGTTVLFPEHANHVLKYESRERSQLAAAEAVSRYNAEGERLDPAATEAILAWLSARAV